MDLIDRLHEIAARIEKQQEHIQTEEATKNALIMPFISALGYDVFNPLEVIPEFNADVGTKKGEKVDYAIKKDDQIIMLFECKWSGADLHKEHAAQLFRYFTVTEARFGILTNGVVYQFYSDIEESNKMDAKPFFEIDLRHIEEHEIAELKKFRKTSFALDDILTTASTLKYTGAIKKILEQELNSPSEPFVRFFTSQIYDKRMTPAALEKFTEIVKEARNQFVNERINDRLKNALSGSAAPAIEVPEPEASAEVEAALPDDNGIVTTQDEIDGYNIIKAILREIVPVKRVAMRDTKSYCGILLDDNNRKPVCRLHFNHQQYHIGLFENKKEERVTIDSLEDIFTYADRIKAAVLEYDGVAAQEQPEPAEA